MGTMRYVLPTVTTIVVSLAGLCAGQARADVALKPRGMNATPLRMKSLSADATVEKERFATTNLDIVFHNSVHERIEADFLYTVPDGAVVTDFAYYYGDERVVARVVEKERAAAIYHYITSRMRDPALVEMVGKNTFRARIFPVMPDADLRVQIRYVQVLPVVKGVPTYTLPIETEKSERLESADIKVHVTDGEPKNNLGVPFTAGTGQGKDLAIKATNWRTDNALKVSFAPSKSQWHEAYYAAPSGGTDGFFALSLAPNTILSKPSVGFAGVTVYDTETQKTDHGILVTGRYRGSGTSTANIRQNGKVIGTFPVTFSATPAPSHPGVGLWASAHIAHLSADSRNTKTVVALSKRFNLPSKWTSWLAVPMAEIERYRKEMALAELSVIAKRWTQLVIDRKVHGDEITDLQRRFDEKFAILGKNHEGELPYFVEQAMHDSIWKLGNAYANEFRVRREDGEYARSLYDLMARLSTVANESPKEMLGEALRDAMNKQAHRIAEAIAHGEEDTPKGRRYRQEYKRFARHAETPAEQTLVYAINELVHQRVQDFAECVAVGRAQSATAARLQREVTTLCQHRNRWVKQNAKNSPEMTVDEVLRQAITDAARGRARSWADALYGRLWYSRYSTTRPRPLEAAKWRKQTERLAKAVEKDPTTFFRYAERPYKEQLMEEVRDAIVTERQKPNVDRTEVHRLETQFLNVGRDIVGETYANIRLERIAAREEGAHLDTLLAQKPDLKQVAELTAQRETLRKREEELRARMGDPLIQIVAPADARSVVALFPDGGILPLAWNAEHQRWEGRFDIPTYATEGDYTVTIIIIRADGTRTTETETYHVDVTAPKGQATLERLADGRWLLRLTADEPLARAVVSLPNGETLSLTQEAEDRLHWYARLTLTDLDTALAVVLTDRAHNLANCSVAAGSDRTEAKP